MATFECEYFTKEYAKEDDTTKTRAIGLELEVEITNEDSKLHKYRRHAFLNDYWDDDEYDDDRDDADRQEAYDEILKEERLPFAGAGDDGEDIELVTHPDSITLYKQGGSKRFKEAMRFLKANAAGGKKTPNSGTHVNVERLKNDDTEYIMDNAYWICMNFAIPLQKIAGRITHWARFNQYSNTGKNSCVEIENTFQKGIAYPSRVSVLTEQKSPTIQRASYNNCKGQCLVKKSYTYEFRIFKATTDKNEVLAWVELCHNIIQLASGLKPVDEISMADLIQGEYISKYVKNLKGTRRLTPLEKAQKIKDIIQLQSYDTGGNILL